MKEYLIYQVGLLPSMVLIPIHILPSSLSYQHLPSSLGETTVVLHPAASEPELKLEGYIRAPSDCV